MFNSHKSTLKESQAFINQSAEYLAGIYKIQGYKAMQEKFEDICNRNMICGMDKTIISDKFWALVL